MTQPGFFDLDRRYESLDQKNDPLVALNRLIPWEAFRPRLRAAFEKAELRASAETRKSAAGRKPWDEIIIFKVLMLQALYNLESIKDLWGVHAAAAEAEPAASLASPRCQLH